MKSNLFPRILLLSTFAASTPAFAGDTPSILLYDGANNVGVTLVNLTNVDATAVSVSVDSRSLPPWLTVQCESGTASAPGGGRSASKLMMVFTVKDAPEGAETLVPLVLRDTYGNVWNSPVLVHASSASLPLQNALYENYQNPFNPATTIKYSLKEVSHASLVIFNFI